MSRSRPIRAASFFAGVILSGCTETNSVSALSCKEIAAEAIRVSDGELISIDQRTLTSREEGKVTCHGTGFYKNGSMVPTRFQAFLNDDGEIMIRYDTDEYSQQQVERADRLQRAEEERNQQEYRQTMAEIDRTLDQ